VEAAGFSLRLLQPFTLLRQLRLMMLDALLHLPTGLNDIPIAKQRLTLLTFFAVLLVQCGKLLLLLIQALLLKLQLLAQGVSLAFRTCQLRLQVSKQPLTFLPLLPALLLFSQPAVALCTVRQRQTEACELLRQPLLERLSIRLSLLVMAL